ncbi:flagellar basal body-associated protein FliL [Oxalobacteraceae bacterium R-40]|uniref:Flagellar protein FliL n=1 Tax=Keguizhuia sedimenti TaxID=3064264 RepID=A0ABU1BRX0_9BURK|nr:flagellar basal body-associated protein FliL [Oxalobacteraceae bacterium R-40]
MATAPKLKPVPDQALQEEAPKKSKFKLFLILGITCILLAGGGGAAWYFMGQQSQTAANKPAVIAPPVFVVLEPFTVNLRSDSEEQFLQVAMTVQVKDQANADQMKLYMPEVRNRLLLLLSSKSGAEILSPEGKKQLSDEIIASLKNPFAPNTKAQGINNVFFTSFVVQ